VAFLFCQRVIGSDGVVEIMAGILIAVVALLFLLVWLPRQIGEGLSQSRAGRVALLLIAAGLVVGASVLWAGTQGG
jgi:flagellar biogenesis protein FliO